MLELAPLFWERTRARLDPIQLTNELGPINVPVEPLDTRARRPSSKWRRAEVVVITR